MVKDVQFVHDAEGRKTAALVPLDLYEAFEDLWEDQHLARAARVALSDEERIPWDQVKAELIAEGKLDV